MTEKDMGRTIHEMVDEIWAEAIEGMCSDSYMEKDMALERISDLCSVMCSSENRVMTLAGLLREALALAEAE